MIVKNYLKVAVRSLIKQRVHSIINIAGLSVGVAVCLLISLYVVNELSYDRFHRNGDRIYLLPMTWHFGGTVLPTHANCTAGGPFMKEMFSEVEEYVRFGKADLSFRKDETVVNEAQGLYSDSAFFKLFSFSLLAGNPEMALTDPLSIILTRRLAEKYFGADWQNQNITEQTLSASNGQVYRITGVVENVPVNSHIKFDYLVSFSSIKASKQITWDNSEFITYLLLAPGANSSEILAQIPDKLDQRFSEGTHKTIELDLVPFFNIYLHNQKYSGMPNISDRFYVRVFGAIAFIVLLIATVNYINLATSRSMERSLEVGVRKVMGAFRRQLFAQFMIESFLTTALSIVVAILLAKLTMPLFNWLTGKSLDLTTGVESIHLINFAAACILISVLAGIYPAVVVSRYQPVKVLKGKLKDPSGISMRRILVVFQFCISIALIISTLTLSSQLSFIRNADTGVAREKLATIAMDSFARTRIIPFKAELSKESFIKSVSASNQSPVRIRSESAVTVEGGSAEERILMTVWPVDTDIVKTAGIEIAHGENFSEKTPKGEWQLLINEAALPFFGWTKEEAISKKIKVWGQDGHVKGIVKNFHFSTFHDVIKPLIIFAGNETYPFNQFIVNSEASPSDTRAILEKHWKAINPDSPFSMFFVDQRYQNLYEKEIKLGKVVNVFAFLAILISALGLFGLASHAIMQRTKELGIRKVLGASVSGLIIMVSRDFIKLILISFFLAAPISYYFMMQWLERFAYKVEFNWLLVAAAGFAAILIGVGTVTYHSLQVSRCNPVDSLRSE